MRAHWERVEVVRPIVSNTVRRSVPSREKTELLERLGQIYLNEGIEPGKIAHKIADETGMSYPWVTKYLSDRFKDRSQQHKIPRVHRTGICKLLEPPEGVLSIRAYANTDFVNIIVKKHLFEKLEEKAKKLEITPDVLIYNLFTTSTTPLFSIA